MLIRIVKMNFQPEKTAEFLQMFDDIKHKIRRFDGCEHLELMQDYDDPNSFSTYSKWHDDDALNAYRNSDLFDTFIDTKTFTVNILNENQQDISNQFSKKEEHSLADYKWERTKNGCLYVPESLVHFDCDTFEQLDGGDHIIFVGKVTDFENRGGKPLLFAQGKYRQIQD